MISQSEDPYEVPAWLKYRLRFVVNNKRELFRVRKEFEEFERNHPDLKLIHAERGANEVTVRDKRPVFRDENEAYYQVKYSFQRQVFTFYYQPSEALKMFLSILNTTRYYRERRKKIEREIK